MGKKEINDPWYNGQRALIKDIENKLKVILDESKGVDLFLDVVNLLKDIKPIKKIKDK